MSSAVLGASQLYFTNAPHNFTSRVLTLSEAQRCRVPSQCPTSKRQSQYLKRVLSPQLPRRSSVSVRLFFLVYSQRVGS